MSKVIAAGIIALLAAFGIWLGNLLPLVASISATIWRSIEPYKWQIISILLGIVATLFWLRGRSLSKKLGEAKSKGTNHSANDQRISSGGPSKWLKSLEQADFTKYTFLAWFPVHETLRSELYRKGGVTRHYGDISFDGIPAMVTLFQKGVLRKVSPTLSEYAIEIDQECYDFLDQIITREANSPDQKIKDEIKVVIEDLSRREFSSIFPQAKNRRY